MLLSPPSYRIRMLRIVAVCVQTQATAEWRVLSGLFLRHAGDEFNQPPMSACELLSDFRERELSFSLGHLCIEGINPTMGDEVAWRLFALENRREVFQSLFFPGCHVGQDVPHRPGACHAGLH